MAVLYFYPGRDILALSDPLAMIAAVEAAIRATDVRVPHRLHIGNGQATLLVMPAVGAREALVKCVTVAPDNPAAGLALIQGLALLNDATTGVPLALFDAARLTGLRTGAVGAIAVKALTGAELDRIGFIGAGEQARWTALHAAAIRPLREIVCLTRTDASFQRFHATVGASLPGVCIRRVADAASLLRSVSCIVTATTSDVPVLPDDEAALEGKTLISIGSFARHAQELPDAAYRLARNVFVDSADAAYEVGDLIGPLERGILTGGSIIPAADLLAGRHAPHGATRVFKSVGYAAFDLYAAADIHRRARETGVGQEIFL